MSANRLKLNLDKTELLWVGSIHAIATCWKPTWSAAWHDVITASDHHHFCILGMSDPSPDWRNSAISASLHRASIHQLQRVRWSLDSNSAATLLHAFVTSRIDYCSAVSILATAPTVVTDKLQTFNGAACVLSGTNKYDRGLSQLLHEQLHWLDVPDRINYKRGVIMLRCSLSQAPAHLMKCCRPVSNIAACIASI